MASIFSKIDEIKKSGRKAALCIIIETKGSTPRKTGSKMIVFDDGDIEGTIGGGSLELQVIEDAVGVIFSNEPQVFKHALAKDLGMACGGHHLIYIEPINPENKLYIFGAGHIGKALAHYTPDFGFTVTLIDHREDIFDESQETKIHCLQSNYLDATDNLTFDENTFVVVVTPKHSFDEDILAKCAKKTFAYLGMIGSKSKIAKARNKYLADETLTEKELDAVDMPIGIKFNAQTPEEIALSILAKMIDVKNSKKL
ncbi:MAG: XdhC family protein [Chlorobi bacterium]|nr:XdhC family protein [Chlorobiota bacterium]